MSEALPFELLEEKGFEVTYKTDWVGEGSGRHEVVTDVIRGVHIELTAAEWCSMCQREGDHYIGPCCGNTGAMQDAMAEVFRDRGYIEAGDLEEVGVNGESHEAAEDRLFEKRHLGGTFSITTRKDYDHALSKWDELTPWGKIGLAYASLAERLPLSRDRKVEVRGERRPLSDEEAFNTLANSLRYVQFERLFTPQEDKGAQHVANLSMVFARMLPATRAVLQLVEKRFIPFEGFALVRVEDGEILKNGLGLCIYGERAEPERLLAKEPEVAELVKLRPVRITVEKGVELL